MSDMAGRDAGIVRAFRIATAAFGAGAAVFGAAASAGEGAALDSPAMSWCLICLIAFAFSALGALAYNIPRNVERSLTHPGLALAHLTTIVVIFGLQAASHAVNPDPAGLAQGYATLVSVYVHMGWLAGMGGIVAASVL